MTIAQLLNKLIEKGWRPFNKDIKEFFTLNEFTCGYRGEGTNHLGTIRAIVSKESGLRQFVCENGMVKEDGQYESTVWTRIYEDERDSEEYKREYGTKTAEYYLIESALCDEDKLEEFLLNSIKLD